MKKELVGNHISKKMKRLQKLRIKITRFTSFYRAALKMPLNSTYLFILLHLKSSSEALHKGAQHNEVNRYKREDLSK